ncbi:SRPBCC family protein [Nocardioides marinquilinus]|uniref:SRPBCC family protein n=1 Tax=Nocardioides marinquilinus TaxID=1210400 RepID=A0ABP9Q187_9ACTN
MATTFSVSRSATIDADPALVHRLVDDLREWRSWSPWEDADPHLERSYTGPERGVGARYAWSGNRRAGRGSMEITGSTPEQVDLLLVLKRPFRATDQAVFRLLPRRGGTEVTWRTTGRRTGVLGVLGVLGRVVPVDRVLGRDVERGLARLTEVAEA